MTSEKPEGLGHLDDEAERHEPASTPADGAAAAGDYDPAEGSPDAGGSGHPVGEAFPEEAVSYDDPDERPRTDTQE